MSVEIAAEYLSISKAALTTLQVECVRLGRRRLYDRLVLDRYVDALSGMTSVQHDDDAARQRQIPADPYLRWKVQDRINQAKLRRARSLNSA